MKNNTCTHAHTFHTYPLHTYTHTLAQSHTARHTHTQTHRRVGKFPPTICRVWFSILCCCSRPCQFSVSVSGLGQQKLITSHKCCLFSRLHFTFFTCPQRWENKIEISGAPFSHTLHCAAHELLDSLSVSDP